MYARACANMKVAQLIFKYIHLYVLKRKMNNQNNKVFDAMATVAHADTAAGSSIKLGTFLFLTCYFLAFLLKHVLPIRETHTSTLEKEAQGLVGTATDFFGYNRCPRPLRSSEGYGADTDTSRSV